MLPGKLPLYSGPWSDRLGFSGHKVCAISCVSWSCVNGDNHFVELMKGMNVFRIKLVAI